MTAPAFVTSWYPILQVSSNIVVTPTITPGSGHQFANAAISVVPVVSAAANAIYTDSVTATITPTVTAGTGITFPGETTSVSVTPSVSVAAGVVYPFASAVTVTPSVSVTAEALLGVTPTVAVTPSVSVSGSVVGSVVQSAITATPSVVVGAAGAGAPAVSVTPSVTAQAGVIYPQSPPTISVTPAVSASANLVWPVASAITATPSIATAAATASIAFDALGTGVVLGGGGSSATWSHNSATGAYVLAFFVAGTVSSVKYGTSAMTALGTVTDGSGNHLNCYGISGVATGSTTIAVTQTFPGDVTGNSISFTGAMSPATPTTNTYTTTSSGSQSPTCISGQMIVQCFEDFNISAITSSSGGTPQWTYTASSGAMTISTATASTTFTAGLSTTDKWAALSVVLSA